ncbi:uncharacterized protein [Equus przewalskii]|uniref:Uncharacterized protein isoform X3 n=1 Tax=Equus przewalskii TaxID=9798 RepID=A0ABM4JQA7_EQUPR
MRARTCVGDFSFQVRGRWWMSRDLVGPEGAVFKNGNLGELWCVAEGARSATGGSLTQVHDTLGTAETTQEGCAGPRTPPVWGGSGQNSGEEECRSVDGKGDPALKGPVAVMPFLPPAPSHRWGFTGPGPPELFSMVRPAGELFTWNPSAQRRAEQSYFPRLLRKDMAISKALGILPDPFVEPIRPGTDLF